MHKTRNDLPEKSRAEIVPILNARVADAIDLMQQARQAHWNVRGPSFIALHKLFDDLVESVEDYVDLLAERVVQLGGTAEGTVQAAARRSELPELSVRLTAERDLLESLASALAAFGMRVRHGIEQADGLGDKDTADILTEVSRGVDKYLWFIEAHLPTG
jgi:starvation-inducible DNA-binding protein